MHLNFEEACGEEIGVTLPNLAFPKLILCCMPFHSHLGSTGDPALGYWRAQALHPCRSAGGDSACSPSHPGCFPPTVGITG